MIKKGIAAIVGALLLGGVGLWTFGSQSSGSSPEIYFKVSVGELPRHISARLEQEKVISNQRLFFLYGRLTGAWGALKAGEYALSGEQSHREILDLLTSGISAAMKVTIPEGDNLFQVAARLEDAGLVDASSFIQLCQDRTFITSLGFHEPEITRLEGYLYPETYFFPRDSDGSTIATKMVQAALALWDDKRSARATELGLSRHQVFTLASMIEKETGASSERKLISSVFHNRLKKKMRLQSDPTTIYGIWERYDGNIHRSDLLTYTPYNTYKIPALPIGPIANPGIEALDAALYPETSSYLYFVSRNDGTHVFSSSLKEHEAAVRAFQLNPKARAGKSWRDLNKKPQTSKK